MGYTHYWYRQEELDKENFSNAIKDIALLLSFTEGQDFPVGYNHATRVIDVFELNSTSINFNGIGEQAHETFSIEQTYLPSNDILYEMDKDKLWKFSCCKTSFEHFPYKPYDLYVTACLYIFKYHLGDEFLVCSDGDVSDWSKGIQMVQDILGYPDWIADFEFDKEPDTDKITGEMV